MEELLAPLRGRIEPPAEDGEGPAVLADEATYPEGALRRCAQVGALTDQLVQRALRRRPGEARRRHDPGRVGPGGPP
ncbi:hypothetical protein ACWGDX_27005 [Streptomyces sp. NPDC055025]